MKKAFVGFRLHSSLFWVSLALLAFWGNWPTTLVAQAAMEKGVPFVANYHPQAYKGSSQIWSVQQDDRGLMYFGGQNHILEYDGVKWRQISLPGKPSSSVVRAMAKAPDGVIYYGGAGDVGYLGRDSVGNTKAISLLHLIPRRFHNFNDVWTVQLVGNQVYFQAREYIFRINSREASDSSDTRVWEPESRFMYAIYVEGEYFVHQQGKGLYRMVRDSLQFIPGSEFLGEERMHVMLPYPATAAGEKQFLIGQFYSGFTIFNGKTFRRYSTQADPLVKSGSLLYRGIKLKDGTYAISTTGSGAFIMDTAGRLLQHIDRKARLQDESVYSLHEDKNGMLWLGLDNGIARVETASPITRFDPSAGIIGSVLSIHRSGSTLYVGTANGLFSVNPNTQTFERIPGIPQNQVFSMLNDGDQLLVPGDGLFGVKNGKGYTIKKSVSGDMSLSILHISKDHPNIMYGGGTFGMSIFTRKMAGGKPAGNWVFKGYVPGITDQIWTFSEEPDGTLWAGTQNNLVYRITMAFDPQGEPDMKAITGKPYGPESGMLNTAGTVFHAKNSTYFPTDSFFYAFDKAADRFVRDTTFGYFPNGRGNEEVFMIEDSNGRVWLRMGQQTRLATPRPDGTYDLDDNILNPLSEMSISSIYPEANGIVWITATDGLIRFDERLEKNSRTQEKTLLRHVTAGKHVLVHDQSLESAGGKIPEVAFKENTLRFEYAAPFYEQENKTVFQTWLEGFDAGWSDWDNNYYKEYTNLPPGKYTFHVRSKNIHNRIGEEAVYTFRILHPWYSTWWAYTLYILLGLGLFFGIIRYRTRQLHEKHRILEQEVEARTAELRHRVDELAVINSVQEGLVREMSMQGIYEMVGEKIREIFKAQVVDIVTYDRKVNLLTDRYSYEKGDRSLAGSWEPKSFRKHVVDTGQTLLINGNMEEASASYGAVILQGEMPKSAVFVPLVSGNQVKGMISLQNLDRENAFSDTDVSLITTLANSMSVALQSASRFDETNRLLKETEQRNAELAVINSVQDGLAKELDVQAICELVGHRIQELFDTQTVIIRTFDHASGLENWQYGIEKGEKLHADPRPIIWANKLLIQSKQPLLINENYTATAQKYGSTGVTAGLPPKSAIFVPMVVGDTVRGSISLQNTEKEHAFSDTDVRLLTTLTNSMAVALENARLFEETRRLLDEAKQRANELSTVNSISQALASQLNLDDLIQLVGEQLRQLFRANIVYLAILDEKTKIIHFPYQYGDNMAPMKLGDGLTSQIINTRKPLLINKDLRELHAQMGVQQVGIPAASYLGVPIPVGNEVIGVLSVQSTEQENRFDDDALRLLTTIAASVGVAMRKAKLFEELQAAKLDADNARKVAEKANHAKSAFLSTVSHELRTPLTSVLGFAKIIKKRLEEKIFPAATHDDPKIQKTIAQVSENLDVVVAEGQRLTHLINDVLDLAKIEAGKMEWNMENITMPEIAERAIAATSALFEHKDLTLEKNIHADLPEVSGDRDKLIQVMVNLISNAVKFTPEGKVTFSVYQQDDEVVVAVTDTGIGIAPEDHSAVFEQFKQVGDTLTDKPKGTGLGLPICKEIIEHHGGRLWLESEPGKGSTFFFALPVVSANAPKPIQIEDLVRQLKEQVAQSQVHLGQQSARLLIVDDDDSIRSLLHQELSDAGYLIEEARNGKEALARVRANCPDLIILDIMMPEMNGFDVAAVLKNDPQTMDIPIIVLSIVQDKIRGFRIGIDRYLTKPIDTGLLFNEIGSLLEQGKSRKKVMIVDEDMGTVNTLTDVLKTKGYQVMESNTDGLIADALSNQPDIIIIKSALSEKQDFVKTLRFEKGMENVLFLVYQ